MWGRGSPVCPLVRAGQILGDRYRVERVLAEGRESVLVAAHHIQRDEKVTLSLWAPEFIGNDAAAEQRFLINGRGPFMKLKSEHAARVTDVGRLADGTPYMEMEALDGEDLEVWLKGRGILPIEQAVEFVLQACVAVAEAHALGIVHRDLKPDNLLCTQRRDGQPSIKVICAVMCAVRTAIGTPLYMSPEQFESSARVDARTDIWALGVILFELMTGRPPFQADSVTEAAFRIATEPAPGVRTLRPEVPVGLEAVILKCLEKEREKRYRTVEELALALLPFAPERAKASVEEITSVIGR